MKNPLFLPSLFIVLALLSCSADPHSKTSALPFLCKGQNASEIYFDQGQKDYLSGRLEGKAIKTLLVFGDSLSDSGELGRKSRDLLVPKCKYWYNHFSNGPLWSEYISGGTGWDLKSYAVGGSGTSKRLGNSLIAWLSYLNPFAIKDTFQDLVLTSLLDQVDNFIKEYGSGKSPIETSSTVVSVWTGANNYFLQGRDVQDRNGVLDPIKAQQLVDDTIGDIREAIIRLNATGFDRLSVGNIPDLSRLAELPPDPSHIFNLASYETLKFLSRKHNEGIAGLVESFRGQGLDIIIFHAKEINDASSLQAQKFGFDSIMPCYSGNIFGTIPSGENKEFCQHPLRQKSWDYPHPNTRMHCIYASQFAEDARQAGWIEKGEGLLQACVDMRTKAGVE